MITADAGADGAVVQDDTGDCMLGAVLTYDERNELGCSLGGFVEA